MSKLTQFTQFEQSVLEGFSNSMPTDAVRFVRGILNSGFFGATAGAVFSEDGAEWAEIRMLASDTAKEDAEAQARLESDISDGFLPIGLALLFPDKEPFLCLFPWVLMACETAAERRNVEK